MHTPDGGSENVLDTALSDFIFAGTSYDVGSVEI